MKKADPFWCCHFIALEKKNTRLDQVKFSKLNSVKFISLYITALFILAMTIRGNKRESRGSHSVRHTKDLFEQRDAIAKL